MEIEGRMQALFEYHLSDDPVIKPELDRLRPGTGHRDLANDLLGYARIYELRADVVKDDRKLYRAGDAARAGTRRGDGPAALDGDDADGAGGLRPVRAGCAGDEPSPALVPGGTMVEARAPRGDARKDRRRGWCMLARRGFVGPCRLQASPLLLLLEIRRQPQSKSGLSSDCVGHLRRRDTLAAVRR
ncbi:hypothetical protein [Sorangium sp. So ce124]|uniref:hypothetical protein n=1 Tax=Sorangium sp. So ce124 TaxID=3133280 RepID=UPI003F5D9344